MKTDRRLALILTVLCLSTPAWAVGILRIDETKSISIAVGVKSSLFASGGTPAGAHYDALLEQALVSLGAEYSKVFKLQINLGKAPTGEIRLIDGIGMFEPLPEFKIWLGRMIVPTDRAALSGPYFSSSWDAPFVSAFPSIFAGRDDGVTVWGAGFAGKLKYQAGVYRGRVGTSNVSGQLLFAGRATLNLLELEPSYYTSGTYFGTRDVLAFGIGGRRQSLGAGTADNAALFYGWSADVFFEKRLGELGTLTVEGAYHRYSTGSVVDATVPNGEGFYAVLGYLLPFPIGPGKLQLVGRHQGLWIPTARIRDEATLNYFINGAYLRVGLNGWLDQPGNTYGLKLGLQIIL